MSIGEPIFFSFFFLILHENAVFHLRPEQKFESGKHVLCAGGDRPAADVILSWHCKNVEHMARKMEENLLLQAIADGTIDEHTIQQYVEMAKRKEKEKELLKAHPYQPYQTGGWWCCYVPSEDGKRRRIKRRKKEDLEKAIVEYQKALVQDPTVESVFQEWNKSRWEMGKIAETTYMRNSQIFTRHFSEFGRRHMSELSPVMIGDFLEGEIYRCHLSAKAFANLKGLTKGTLKRAKKRGLVQFAVQEIFDDLDVSDCSFAKSIHEDKEEVFDEEETDKVIAYCQDNLDLRNAGILLMFLTGMRVGEMSAIRHEDIHDCAIDVRRTETRSAKPGGGYSYPVKEYPKTKAGVRTVVVPREYEFLVARLYWASADREYVFEEDGIRIDTFKFRKRLTRICRDLGIVHKAPHKIRKTYGTILLDAGVDKRLITDQMGHEDIAITETHYHRNRKSLEKKSEIISAIPDFQSSQKRAL